MSRLRAVRSLQIRKPSGRPLPPTPEPPITGYADTVANPAGAGNGGPIAYWRLGSAAAVTDEIGDRDGTLAGSGQILASGLPQSSDGAINFGGNAYATIPHHADFDLTAFSLSGWFRVPAVPGDEEPALALVVKSTAPVSENDFLVYIPSNDANVFRVRFRGPGATNIEINSTVGIATNVPHHFCVRGDSTGFDAYLDGQYLGKNTNYTLALSANTADWMFANSPTFVGPGNCILDEIALYDRVLTEAEVLSLAQRDLPGQAPTAVDDSAVVDEEVTTVIDVVSGDGADIFAGQKADLTVTIVDDSEVTAAGHSVSVNGNNDIAFVAGAVSGNQNVAFTYTITDANGTSNAATVAVTVVDGDVVAPSNANCYPATGLSAVNVNTTANIATQANAAAAGTHILVAAGTYNGNININAQGTEANPIVIRPANGVIGSVIATGTWTLANTSQRVVIVGVKFNGGRIDISGDHNRVDLCSFVNMTSRSGGVRFTFSRDGRVSRCDFGTPNSPDLVSAIHLDPNGFDNGTNVRNLVDYCYIHDFVHAGTANGSELISTFRQDANYLLQTDVFTMDHCLITGYNADNENELATVKSGGWTVKYTTFDGNAGYWNFRNGCFGKVISCWVEDATKNGNAGVNCKAKGHLVAGCRFVRSHCEVAPGNFDTDDETPTQFQNRTGSSPHPAARDCDIVDCVFDNCNLVIGPNDAYPGGDVDAENNNHFGNTFINGGQLTLGPKQTNTTNTDPGLGPFDAAVKLTTDDVGLNADDPYC